MKKITLFIIVITMYFTAKAADTTIVFRKVTFDELFNLSKAESKPILLYFHFKGCGACTWMEDSVFTQKEVADFYNSKFICYDVNTLEEYGKPIAKEYKVKLQPCFIIIDQNKTVLSKIIGKFKKDDFIRFGNNSFDKDLSIESMKEQYKTKNKDSIFMYKYCYMLDDMNSLKQKYVSDYLATQSDKDLLNEKNIRFIYQFCLVDFEAFIPFDCRAYNTMLNNIEIFSGYFDKNQIDTRLVWIATKSMRKAINTKDELLFNKILDVFNKYKDNKKFEFHEMDGRFTGILTDNDLVLNAKLKFYRNSDNQTKYNAVLAEYLEKYNNSSEELNSIAWDYYEFYSDNENLQKAVEWVKKSLDLKCRYSNLDTYACLLYKLGDYKNALIQAEKAIEYAKKEEDDYTETSKLIDKIKKKM